MGDVLFSEEGSVVDRIRKKIVLVVFALEQIWMPPVRVKKSHLNCHDHRHQMQWREAFTHTMCNIKFAIC